MERWTGVLGIFFVLLVSFIFSKSKRRIPWPTIYWGLGLQFVFAFLILGIPALGIAGPFKFLFYALNDLVNGLISYSEAGSKFVFGSLGEGNSPAGFIFAFRALPPIIFFSALTAVFYHLGILQKVVVGIGWVMRKTMKASGAETLSTAANIFLGQNEAPLVVRPYIAGMTRSEIFCVMVGGMATVAAGVMAAYVELLRDRLPEIGGHLLTASFMSAPAAILVSKMLLPETEEPVTQGEVKLLDERSDTNVIEALARGAAEGLQMALTVAGMLIAFIAVAALLDSMLMTLGNWINFGTWGRPFDPHLAADQSAKLSFSLVLGWIFSPVAWLIGIPWAESAVIGKILGEKVVLNEFVAYISLSKIAGNLSDRSLIIASYALCGFANFSSIGIQFGGIGILAPNQKPNLAKLGLFAVLGGSLSTFLTASIAGLFF